MSKINFKSKNLKMKRSGTQRREKRKNASIIPRFTFLELLFKIDWDLFRDKLSESQCEGEMIHQLWKHRPKTVTRETKLVPILDFFSGPLATMGLS